MFSYLLCQKNVGKLELIGCLPQDTQPHLGSEGVQNNIKQ